MSTPSALSASDLLSSLMDAHPEQALNFAMLYDTCARDMPWAEGWAIPTEEELAAYKPKDKDSLTPFDARISAYKFLDRFGATAYLASKLTKGDPVVSRLSKDLGAAVALMAVAFGISAEELAERIVRQIKSVPMSAVIHTILRH
jgi:hypothetical protein